MLADVFEKFRNGSLKKIWIMPDSLFECTSFKLGCNAQYDKSWSWTYFKCGHVFERWGVKFTFLKHTVKPTIIIWNLVSKQESEHSICLDVINSYGYAMPKFLTASSFKWIDPKEFDLDKYTSNSLKGCVLEVDLEYPKELR